MLNSSARLVMVDARGCAMSIMLVIIGKREWRNALISSVWVCLLVPVKKHPVLML